MVRGKICTTVSEEDWKYAQQHRLRWADLIHSGIIAHMKPDILADRMRGIENELNAYKRIQENKKKRFFLG